MLPIQDKNSVAKFSFWTIAIILVNIYVFYLTITASIPDQFVIQYALIPSEVHPANLSSLLPFITSQFLHGGIIHIASNMLFLWVFGGSVERVFGFFVFPIFYLFSGIIGGLTQYFFMPTDTIPMIGASGAVAGILGAYFALFPTHKIRTLVFIFIFVTIIEIPAYFLLFFWFITQLLSSAASVTGSPGIGGIAFLAHIAGFVFGWLTAVISLPKKNYSTAY